MGDYTAFEIMREPAATLLRWLGVKWKKKESGSVTWYKMEVCPACNHNGYQCGISESAGTDGKLIHGVKCWHLKDSGFDSDTPEYEDFLLKVGRLTHEQWSQVKNFSRGNSPLSPRPWQPDPSSSRRVNAEESLPPVKPLNDEFNARLAARLRENRTALAYLSGRGLTGETINYFGLGLSKPYERRDGLTQADALVYPVRAADGRLLGKYGYYNVPGVTQNPTSGNGWMSGPARVYYADARAGRKTAFVCEGPKDVWRHWQALRGTHLADSLLLLTGTHGSVIPEEWKDPRYWDWAEVVVAAHDNDEAGDRAAETLAALAGREVKRLKIPEKYGKDLTDFWNNGGTVGEFEALLGDAPVVSQRVEDGVPGGVEEGTFAYDPVDINGAYHGGHLYYTAQVLARRRELVKDGSGKEEVRVVERRETVVVRSDRTVHQAIWSQPPQNTRHQDRVIRLAGILIDHEPRHNKYGTWSWPSIKAYLDGASRTRPLREILRDVTSYLKDSVWLPCPEDYAALTLTVPVTFTQAVFDSVPLIFLTGPAGSGKSHTGAAMTRVCANAATCGISSAASMARLIDQSRGFVVMDDLETVGSKGGEFNELAQALKLSYNKATAVKLWTDVKTMRTETLNFYGVKMINNTSGVDNILGSRMFRIQTLRMPEDVKERYKAKRPAGFAELRVLRDELHTWSFENVALVEAEYKRLFPGRSDRAEEIAAPLKVFASLAGDRELSEHLEVFLARQQIKARDIEDPVEVMEEALKSLIAQGYTRISITHLVLEMRTLIGSDYGKSFTNEIPQWAQPDWVGRQLKSHMLIEQEGWERQRVFGANLRFYAVRASYVDEVRRSLEEKGLPFETSPRDMRGFCRECESCPYTHVACSIKERRTSQTGGASKAAAIKAGGARRASH